LITAIDTRILLDVLLEDPAFSRSSEEALRRTGILGSLVICEVVYAELAGLFPDHTSLETFLREAGIRLVPSPMETLWKAGELWRRFCLGKKKMKDGTRRILADFLIGAHALLQAEQLITRDKDFYHSTFADLKII